MQNINDSLIEDQPVIISKNSREEYRFSLGSFHGRDYVDVRVYYLDDDSDEWKPFRKGVTISPSNWRGFRGALDPYGDFDQRVRAASVGLQRGLRTLDMGSGRGGESP